MKKILMLIASLCVINTGFAMDDNQAATLFKAIKMGNLAKVQEMIRNGTPVDVRQNGTLQTGLIHAFIGPWTDHDKMQRIVQFLLESGADVSATNAAGMTALMFATALQASKATILQLLTHIPLKEQLEIKEQIKPSIIAALGLIKRNPEIYSDIRKLITNAMVAQLADKQMNRINELLTAKSNNSETAQDIALGKSGLMRKVRPEIAQLLDLTNPASYTQIRAAVEKNIRRILFGPQQNLNQ